MVIQEYVPIKTETVKNFADAARRLSGSDNELTTDEMLSIFHGVSNAAGITATDDGNGNVTVHITGGVTVVDDDDGNVVIG